MVWALWTTLVVLGGVLLLVVYGLRIESQFRRCFLSQNDVRRKLGELALRFHEACRLEIQTQQRLMMSGIDSVDSVRHDLAHASAIVAEAKKDFWQAVKLAKKMGYVEGEVTSYNIFLPIPVMEKRVL